MAISTMIVYSIFYMVGNSAVPYIPEGATTPPRYEDAQMCKEALTGYRSDLASKMPSEGNSKMSPQQRTEYDKKYSQAQSMSCEEIEIDLPPPSEKPKVTGVPSKATTVVMWKIGRIDDLNIFHGTAYNEYAYDDEDSCKDAFTQTQSKVFDQAVGEGANNVRAADILSIFNTKYHCESVALTPEQIKRPQKKTANPVVAHDNTTAPVPTQSYVAPVNTASPVLEQVLLNQTLLQQQLLQQQQNNAVPEQAAYAPQPMQVYAPQGPVGYAPSPYLGQNYPVRPVYITENIRDPYGNPSRYTYPTPYASVPQCWSAVNQLYGTIPSERRNNATCTFGPR